MRSLIMLMILFGVPAEAEWERISGPDIVGALTEKTLVYDGATQHFYASGRTLYNAGRDSWGYWEARGDQYCSKWPPGDLWACYKVERDGDQVRFVAVDGSSTVGRYAE